MKITNNRNMERGGEEVTVELADNDRLIICIGDDKQMSVQNDHEYDEPEVVFWEGRFLVIGPHLQDEPDHILRARETIERWEAERQKGMLLYDDTSKRP